MIRRTDEPVLSEAEEELIKKNSYVGDYGSRLDTEHYMQLNAKIKLKINQTKLRSCFLSTNEDIIM